LIGQTTADAQVFPMTAFDDDPEYEAQLKHVLDSTSTFRDEDAVDEEMGEFIAETDTRSEDSVLDDAPTFRLRIPKRQQSSTTRISRGEEEGAAVGVGDDKALSEDARSISTGDDSPSVQVQHLFFVVAGDLRVGNRGFKFSASNTE